MRPPPFIGLACCCNLVKHSLNLRWKSVRSLAYTTCSNLSDSSSGTNVLCQPLGKFNRSETLDQWKRERSSALLFVRHLKDSGFNHDVETYMAIVRLLCDSGMDVRLNNLFMYAIDKAGFEISHLLEALIEDKLIKAVEVLVKLYASLGRFEEALHALSEMKSKSGLMVSTRTCNFVMNEMIEWGEVDMIESVYMQLKMKGLIPNVYTYGILMKLLCLKGRSREAGNLIIQMELAGVKPNAFIVGKYIHALCSIESPDFAFRVVKMLKESNYPVDSFAYTCVIRGFVKESKLQDAEEVFLDMKLRQVVPDIDCYCALVGGYYKKGDTMKVSSIAHEMESRGINANYIVTPMMQSLGCLGDGGPVDTLVNLKFYMENGIFPDGVMFNLAMNANCELDLMDDAMGILEEMKGRKMKPSKMHYRTLINGFCQWDEPWNALNMFQEMMRNGLRPDSTTYHVLARGFDRCGVSLPLYMLFKHV